MPKHNEFTDTERPISVADLDKIERALGLAFPPDVREHYLKRNGGSPNRYLFKRDDRVYVVQGFLSVRFGPSHNRLENVFQDLKIDREILPKKLVPFAIDPGGDYYCFSVDEVDKGAIYVFVGEHADAPERATLRLANSLPEFIEGMVDDEDD